MTKECDKWRCYPTPSEQECDGDDTHPCTCDPFTCGGCKNDKDEQEPA